ncbi:MAG: hypothetical protein AAF378_25690, partial [Cyanobacteria bacterium P01_A01_bin.84]
INVIPSLRSRSVSDRTNDSDVIARFIAIASLHYVPVAMTNLRCVSPVTDKSLKQRKCKLDFE